MNSPFVDFAETTTEAFNSPENAELHSLGPFSDTKQDYHWESVYENDNQMEDFPMMEAELSGQPLQKAVELNEQYKKLYKWGNSMLMILPQIGADPAQYPAILSDPKKFAIALAQWQEKNGYRGTSLGVLDLNSWTHLQKKIGYHNLSNKHNINVNKAIAANKKYETNLWTGRKDDIYNWFVADKITSFALPISDEFFAYAVADFQALKKLSVDGILGPGTWEVMKKRVVPTPPPAPVPVGSPPLKWRRLIPDAVQSPAEPIINGNDAFKKMVDVIKTAKEKGHFIYLLSGWVVDIDFCLSPNTSKDLQGVDTSSSLRNLLANAGKSGVEIKILSWNNPKTLTELQTAEKFITDLRVSHKANALMFRDNFTYGTAFMKKVMGEVQSKMSSLDPFLNKIGAWNDWHAKAKAFPNEGSHHEKILIVNGTEGLVAFCGGIDINSDRIIGIKGLCCLNPNPSHDCDLELTSDKKWRSRILHDVHCKLKGKAAEILLQRFIDRWNLHLSNSVRSVSPLKSPAYKKTIDAITADTPYVKVTYTFNHPVNLSIKDRSILRTVQLAIENAERSIQIEDQYMISPEIAGWLNKAVRKTKNLQVKLYTQDDEFADIMFTHRFRRKFRSILYDGLSKEQIQRVKIYMLDPKSSPPTRRRVHSKTYIIDDELAIIGSANCNRRSMTFDSETSVILFQENSSSQGSIVKKLSQNLATDRYNKWIEYKENNSLEALDMDVKIKMSGYYSVAASLFAVSMGVTGPLLMSQILETITKLLQKVIDPYPDGEPGIIYKELASDEIENENIPYQLPEDFNYEHETALNENSPFSGETLNDGMNEEETFLNESAYDSISSDPHKPCNCGKKKKAYRENEESEIESGMEHFVPTVKPCDTHICWVKAALNQVLGLNLAITNTLNEETKNAIADFQSRNNLSQTRKIDPATERALLEADALQRTKGTVQAAAAIATITAAKIKIEDWTIKGVSGVKNKPQHILNSFRDPRKLWAFVLHQMAFKRKGPDTKQYSDPSGYVNTGAHFCIMLDGRIIQLHPMSRMIWHGNCISPRSVAVEFEGNFPNVKGRWWIDTKSKVQNKDVPTQAQYESGRFLASYLKTVLGTTQILAHRQSSDSRENDPGPDIWFNVGQWAVNNLGLTDGGPSFKCGTGNPLLPEWKTWGDKSNALIGKEYDEEVEWEDAESESMEYLPEMEDEAGAQGEYDSFYETETTEKDWPKAIRMNRYYADKLGWNQYHDQINNLLLPFSGQQNVDLGEEAFAQAVSAWQLQQGFSDKDSDGIIGPNTWKKMQPALRISGATPVPPAPSTPSVPSGSSIDKSVVSRIGEHTAVIEKYSSAYGINPNLVRGIIASESGGRANTGEGKSGYKGLMMAETTDDQLQAAVSVEAGIKKYILFRDKILNPWLSKLGIPPSSIDDVNYHKMCLSCYNAGPVTALKAIQFASKAGDWRHWLSPEHYKRALVFSGGYDRYSSCNRGISSTEIDRATAERKKYRFKTSGWRTEPDPDIWNNLYSVLHPVMRCWIETKYNNTPGYLDKFIRFYKHFEATPVSHEVYETMNYMDDMYNEEEINFEGSEFEDLTRDWSNAIRQNNYYASKLGWQQYYDQINTLLLPYSGQQNVSLGEEAFAEAAAAWQQAQGLTADGIIGPNTWNRMKSMLNSAGQQQPPAPSPVNIPPPSGQNIFYNNKWYAQKILDAINAGVVAVNPKYNPKPQLEMIVQGFPVKNVDPRTRTLQILPIMYHICDSAFVNNYRDIMLGSFIRDPSNGKCKGHCEGRCIDINFKGGGFDTPGSVQMVINILTYLTSLPAQFKKKLGFGLPVQGNFFARGGSVLSDIIDNQVKQLISQLGIVFTDNPNHLHIQVRWIP